MKTIDLLVTGATGFVGRRFCQYLIDQRYHQKINIVFSARNLKKLKSFFPNIEKTCPQISLIELDLLEEGNVSELVKKTKIVTNFAGPFDLFAEQVVRFCAEHGSHYIDITGEIQFARRMIEKYDKIARSSGATIVPFCGFDSIPSDLGVILSIKKLKEKFNTQVKSVDIIYSSKGGFNGGTIASAINIANKLNPIELLNNNFLIPEKNSEITHPRKVRFIKEKDLWVTPFFMEPVNNKVIYRSKHLFQNNQSAYEYDENFNYQESMAITKNFSKFSSLFANKTINTFEYLCSKKWGQKVITRLAPAPGEGPSEAMIADGFFKAKVIARDSKNQHVEIDIIGKGDPGNKCTANLMLSCLDILIEEKNLPKGLQTPASAFGLKLVNTMSLHEFSFKGI